MSRLFDQTTEMPEVKAVPGYVEASATSTLSSVSGVSMNRGSRVIIVGLIVLTAVAGLSVGIYALAGKSHACGVPLGVGDGGRRMMDLVELNKLLSIRASENGVLNTAVRIRKLGGSSDAASYQAMLDKEALAKKVKLMKSSCMIDEKTLQHFLAASDLVDTRFCVPKSGSGKQAAARDYNCFVGGVGGDTSFLLQSSNLFVTTKLMIMLFVGEPSDIPGDRAF